MKQRMKVHGPAGGEVRGSGRVKYVYKYNATKNEKIKIYSKKLKKLPDGLEY